MIREISIDEIKLPEDGRRINDECVGYLIKSIGEIGLLSPIIVREVEDEIRLVAGQHRVRAHKLAGWETIKAIFLETDDLRADLATIDENLIRSELTDEEMEDEFLKRKQLYLEMYPETAAGANIQPGVKGTTKRQDDAPLAFTEDTANKMGVSRRTVERKVARAEERHGLREPKPRKEREPLAEQDLEKAFKTVLKHFQHISDSVIKRTLDKALKEMRK